MAQADRHPSLTSSAEFVEAKRRERAKQREASRQWIGEGQKVFPHGDPGDDQPNDGIDDDEKYRECRHGREVAKAFSQNWDEIADTNLADDRLTGHCHRRANICGRHVFSSKPTTIRSYLSGRRSTAPSGLVVQKFHVSKLHSENVAFLGFVACRLAPACHQISEGALALWGGAGTSLKAVDDHGSH